MASRLLWSRGCSASPLKQLINVQRPATFIGIRKYSSSKDDNQIIEPKQKASSIIDSLPGNSLISKTGYITVGTGALTLAISKELYVLNEETLLLLSFSTMCAIIYKALKQPVAEWAVTQKEHVNSILRQAREDHKSAVAERIETVGQIGNLVDITKTLFTMSKETAKLEAEAFELKQKAVAASEIKAVLDSWVRYETSLREREQKALANHVIEKITQQLKDPKLQNTILSEAASEAERALSSKSA